MTTPTTAVSDTYADEVLTIVHVFEFELCAECGADLDAHTIGADPLGHAHAWCTPDTDTGGNDDV